LPFSLLRNDVGVNREVGGERKRGGGKKKKKRGETMAVRARIRFVRYRGGTREGKEGEGKGKAREERKVGQRVSSRAEVHAVFSPPSDRMRHAQEEKRKKRRERKRRGVPKEGGEEGRETRNLGKSDRFSPCEAHLPVYRTRRR